MLFREEYSQILQEEPEKWISVKDRLPTNKHHMVLCCDIKSKYKLVCLGKWLGDFWWIESQINDMKEMIPTHWREIPALPDEE